MIKLSRGWINLGQIAWANDHGNEIEVCCAGKTWRYRGADALTLRAALDFESAEYATAREKIEAHQVQEVSRKAHEKRLFSRNFGEQADGTLIAR